MKKLEKAWIFIWAGAMLLFGLLTVNGLRFQYGDTVRTIVRGVDDLNLGSDLTGGLELALQPESGLPAEQQLLDNAREVLMKRLDYLGIQNAEVTVDSEESRLLVRFPNQPGVSQSDYPEIVSVLTSRNALTVRDGIASDEQGRPTGEILLEEKDIVSHQIAVNYSHKRQTVGDTDNGKQLLKKIGELKELIGAYRSGTIKERGN